ncbi:MAG: tetraprenyl-beta-curcumene synthase family protein [Peptococcaceae bacterium]|nr:tetraprenyl-beta-curcumene synthase family protein [Peptococcaceae bacterium]
MSTFTRHIPNQVAILGRTLTSVLPEVERQLARWKQKINTGPTHHELARQARASISSKRFHAQGGSVYALCYGTFRHDLVRLIVALQIISDYLDNLCDQAGCEDGKAFRQLHQSMLCAVNRNAAPQDFYRYYPYKDDGGYLDALVYECREIIGSLPSYDVVEDRITFLVRLYTDLQVYKHTRRDRRESLLQSWFATYEKDYPMLYWWEFAAAAGSTLAMFALFAASARPNLTRKEVEDIFSAYFPWICGLHILLDYFIDQEEDRCGGDLNFVFYYPDEATCQRRLLLFQEEALNRASSLHRSFFHRTIVKGLPALYLSDPKVKSQNLEAIAPLFFKVAGWDAALIHWLCKGLRRLRMI